MGHRKLGKLPRLRGWKSVISLLDCPTASKDDLARRILVQAENEIELTSKQRALSKLFWQLSRLLWSVKNEPLQGALRTAELPTESGQNVFTLAQALAESCKTEEVATRYPALNELVGQAVQSSFIRLVTPHVPSLFGTGEQELEQALKQISTKTQFGEIARGVLSEYLSRVLSYVASRHSSEQADAPDFSSALQRWSWETGALVEKYSADWYSKHNWLTKGQINRQEAEGYTAFALEKLKSELRISRRDKGEPK